MAAITTVTEKINKPREHASLLTVMILQRIVEIPPGRGDSEGGPSAMVSIGCVSFCEIQFFVETINYAELSVYIF
jgi:hypothetical protein